MSKTVVVTGASGILGEKLIPHLRGLGWTLRLLDIAPAPGVQVADLREPDPAWAACFAGADAVIHLNREEIEDLEHPAEKNLVDRVLGILNFGKE